MKFTVTKYLAGLLVISLLSAPVPATANVTVMDNGKTGTSSTGTWKASSGVNPYGSNSLYSNGGGAYTFNVNLPTPGQYKVFAWWTEYSNRSTSVPYDIAHLGGTSTVNVNQKRNGGQWRQLGSTWNFDTKATISIRSLDNGTTSADAIKLVPVEGNLARGPAPVPAAADVTVMDNGKTGTSSTGTWKASSGVNPYGSNSLYSNGGGAYTFNVNLPTPGQYKVFAWWTEYSNRSTSVPYDITHLGGTSTVNVNQKRNGGQWRQLGSTWNFDTKATISIRSLDNGTTSADAIKLVPVEANPAGGPIPVMSLTSFPINLQGSAPEAAAIMINISKPTAATHGVMTLTTYDANLPDEGELVINGNTPIALFGKQGISGNDQNSASVTINTPASYWNDGQNTLLFRHTRSMGYVVDDIKVTFGQTNPVANVPTNGYHSPMHELASTLLASGLIASGPIVIGGKSDVVIRGKHITNPNGSCIEIRNNASNIVIEDSIIGPCGEKGIYILQSSHVTITGNYIHDTGAAGIMSYQSNDIAVDSNHIENVKSGYEMWTTNIGNLSFTNNFVKNVWRGKNNGGAIAFAAFVSAPGIRINNNIGINIPGESSAEDLINMYKSHGKPNDPIQINNNVLYGGGPSPSGAGINLGDGGGSYQEARNNILVNPAQSGLGMSQGHHLTMTNNKVFSDNQRSFTNVGIGIGWTPSQRGGICEHFEFSNNEITFYKGSHFTSQTPYLEPKWKWSECDVSGWNTNKFDTPYEQPANLDETILPEDVLNYINNLQ